VGNLGWSPVDFLIFFISQERKLNNNSTNTEIVVSVQTMQFISGLAIGVVVEFLFQLSLMFMLTVVAVIFLIFVILFLINPGSQRFIFILIGIFTGIVLFFIIKNFFFNYSLTKPSS
jgi:hypothetical protein